MSEENPVMSEEEATRAYLTEKIDKLRSYIRDVTGRLDRLEAKPQEDTVKLESYLISMNQRLNEVERRPQHEDMANSAFTALLKQNEQLMKLVENMVSTHARSSDSDTRALISTLLKERLSRKQ